MQEAHFGEIASVITHLLGEAGNEVVVAMAWFTNHRLFDALADCLGRGVKVKLAISDDPINFTEYGLDFNSLISLGATVHIVSQGPGLMHHKFCVIDGQMAVTGSYNWTYYAETRNSENIVVIEDAAIASLYCREFARLTSRQTISTTVPRLTWAQIEDAENIDFGLLNFETEQGARELQLPSRKVVKSTARVQIIEKPLKAFSKYNFAILTGSGTPTLLVGQGATLRASCSKNLYSYSDTRAGLRCVLVRWGDKLGDEHVVFDKPLSDITLGRNDEVLTINAEILLDDTGYLHVAMTCVETNQSIDLTDIDSGYVIYE